MRLIGDNAGKKRIRVRIAFLKKDLLGSGGTERYLCNLAVGLRRFGHQVSALYGDVPTVDLSLYEDGWRARQLTRLNDEGIDCCSLVVQRHSPWSIDSKWTREFSNTFHDMDFDVVVTASGGLLEYPSSRLRKSRVVETVHYTSGYQSPVVSCYVVHVSQWAAERWLKKNPGDSRVRVIGIPVFDMSLKIPGVSHTGSRKIDSRIVFGMHQRNSDALFSPHLLEAFAQLDPSQNRFHLLNGSLLYAEQARRLGLNNFAQLPPAETEEEISGFLAGLDVFTHSRADGELNSAAIAEAMSMSLPIVTNNIGTKNLGHVTQVRDVGLVAESVSELVEVLRRVSSDEELRQRMRAASRERYLAVYEPSEVLSRFQELLNEAAATPRPDVSWSKLMTSLVAAYPSFLVRRSLTVASNWRTRSRRV